MEKALYDKNGNAVAYITDGYHDPIYLYDGTPVAYLYQEQHIYGINGRHLGWFIDDILYDNSGERIGFSSITCPVAVGKEPVKHERRVMDELRTRWSAPPTPNLSFNFAARDLADFLREGQVAPFTERTPSEASQD